MTTLKTLAPPLVLACAVVIGLTSGFVLPRYPQPDLVLWPAVFVQTIVAVGGLHPAWIRSRQQRGEALHLLWVHHLIGTLPYVVVWLFLATGARDSALVVGMLCLAIVPTASGLPAYATAARASPVTITGFAFASYVLALVLTPLLGLLIFGAGENLLGLTASIAFGLVVPALLALLVGRWIRMIPPVVRTGIVAAGMVATTSVFAGSLRDTLATLDATLGLIALFVAVGAARVVVSAIASLAFTVRQPGLRLGAAMSSSYKNDALAASVALQVAGPLAILPALGSLVTEIVLMLVIAGLAVRRDRPFRARRPARLFGRPQYEPETTLE